MRYADTGAAEPSAAVPSEGGTAATAETSPSTVAVPPSSMPIATTAGIPEPIAVARSASTQMSAVEGAVVPGAGDDSVHRNGTGYVSEEEPRREGEEQEGDQDDEETFPGCGDRQKPVELFTFFLCFGDGGLERTKWIIEHDRAWPPRAGAGGTGHRVAGRRVAAAEGRPGDGTARAGRPGPERAGDGDRAVRP